VAQDGKSGGKGDGGGPVVEWEDDWSADPPISHERPTLDGEQKVKAELLTHPGQWVTLRTPPGIDQARARRIARRYLRSQPAVTARLAHTQPVPDGTFEAMTYCTIEQQWKVAARYAPAAPATSARNAEPAQPAR